MGNFDRYANRALRMKETENQPGADHYWRHTRMVRAERPRATRLDPLAPHDTGCTLPPVWDLDADPHDGDHSADPFWQSAEPHARDLDHNHAPQADIQHPIRCAMNWQATGNPGNYPAPGARLNYHRTGDPAPELAASIDPWSYYLATQDPDTDLALDGITPDHGLASLEPEYTRNLARIAPMSETWTDARRSSFVRDYLRRMDEQTRVSNAI